MARTEMIQASPSVALAQPSTPPSSPSLLSSEHVVTLSIAQEFLDMVKAVVAMQIASSPALKCTCSHTPPENPIEATSTDLCLRTLCHTSPADQASSQVVSTMQGPPPPPAKRSGESEEPKGRASRLEFKTINEVYVSNAARIQVY